MEKTLSFLEKTRRDAWERVHCARYRRLFGRKYAAGYDAEYAVADAALICGELDRMRQARQWTVGLDENMLVDFRPIFMRFGNCAPPAAVAEPEYAEPDAESEICSRSFVDEWHESELENDDPVRDEDDATSDAEASRCLDGKGELSRDQGEDAEAPCYHDAWNWDAELWRDYAQDPPSD